jgi:DNA-binding transcriptional ArsR family regulator
MGRRGYLNAGSPLEPRFAEALADTMFALSTASRVQILYLLLDRPHDVTELVEALGMEQSSVSHQLRVLREQVLLRVDREGARRVYALADDHVVALLREAERHVKQRSRGQGLLARVRGSAASPTR